MGAVVDSVLRMNEDQLRDWVGQSSSEDHRQALADLSDAIRNNHLYGGQPRSEASTSGVELARKALALSTLANDEALMTEACRMMAYTLNANEQYAESIEYYQRAIDGFERLQDSAAAARNRLGFLYALCMVGRYDESLEVGARAQEWFLANADYEGYARSCVNIGNVYHRMDQHAKSLECHAKAIEYFAKTGNEAALAQTYLNLGNSQSWLKLFDESDQSYATSQAISARLGLHEMEIQARYNRAYLYFLRGRNMEAIAHFSELRNGFNQTASLRHSALCDLDETEIYLQLNLPIEAARLARNAVESFKQLNMAYESAKATAFLGIALTQNRQYGDALQVFSSAQSGFEKEQNTYWIPLCELYRAEVLYAVGRLWESRRFAVSAHEAFTRLGIESKRIVAMLLLGRIAMDLNQREEADRYVDSILEWAGQDANPLLLFPCYAFCAYAAEWSGDTDGARHLYARAAAEMEQRRTHLNLDELRVAFFPRRRNVYESLVRLAVCDGAPYTSLAEAYNWSERAKSASMVSLLSHHWSSIRTHGDEELLSRVNRIREELNSSYLKLKSDEMPMPVANASSVQIKESELLHSLRELANSHAEYVELQSVSTAGLEQLQAAISQESTILEFFNIDNEIIAFIVSRDHCRVVRHVTPLARIRYIENQLRKHFSKFTLPGVRKESTKSPDFANSLLGELYDHLIRPVLADIRTPDLIIVAHGLLHYVPFAALFDGEQYLLDQFNVSHLPRASALMTSLNRSPVEGARPLVLGQMGSGFDEEYAAIRNATPDADWHTGPAFTREVVEGLLRCDFVHISSDVVFRNDNPMFTSIGCTDTRINAIDFYSLRCNTNLLTLSGTVSGINPAAGPDSLVGLIEGFLYWGARSIVMNLWNVDPVVKSEFMGVFYREWCAGSNAATAVSRAAIAIREKRPHPFFWAPYITIGCS